MTWDDAHHVLAVRLDTLGDVLMTTPAIRALKQSRPGRRISLLSCPAGAEAAELVPELDAVIRYEAPWMKATGLRVDSRHEYRMAERLNQEQFDAAVIFTAYSQSPLPAAMLCYLADIPLRLAHCHENPYQLVTHWVRDPEPGQAIRHEVRRQLDLVASIGCTTRDERLSLEVPHAARACAARVLKRLGLDRRRDWIALHAGATAPSRRYPLESFAEAGRQLVRHAGLQIVLTGSESERAMVEDLCEQIGGGAHNVAGLFTLSELAAVIATAPLLLSNNSGPVHVAAAIGTPVVDLYALTNPQHTPWAVPHRTLSHDVPCKYCYKSVCPEGHHDCLRGISPRAVVEAVLELLAEGGESAGAGRPAAPAIAALGELPPSTSYTLHAEA